MNSHSPRTRHLSKRRLFGQVGSRLIVGERIGDYVLIEIQKRLGRDRSPVAGLFRAAQQAN
jgi:hypothetical protein